MRVLRIDKATNTVLNAELWDQIPPANDDYLFVESDAGAEGWAYDPQGGAVSPPALPTPSFEERIEAALAQVEAKMREKFVEGFTVPASFSGVSLTPLTGHVLQVASAQNKLDWLTSQAAYSAAVAGGAGAVEGTLFRTKANVNVTASYNTGLAAILAMAAWGKSLYARRWALKDSIRECEDADDLDVVLDGLDDGWP